MTILLTSKKTPCKYFEESLSRQIYCSTINPTCKFGNKCHYAHIHPASRAGLDFNCRLGTRSDRIGDGWWWWWWIGFLLAVVFGDLVRRRSKTISAQQPKKILLFLDAHEKGAICLQWRGHCFRDLRYLANEIERGLESHSIDIPTRMSSSRPPRQSSSFFLFRSYGKGL